MTNPLIIGPATLYLGDNLAVMAALPDNSVEAVVTDPPAGIAFMSKKWDHDKGGRTHWIAWMTQVAAECLRILKPGGHALVWAIPRTAHWTATAWEDAGFEVRDCIAYCFGSGFPKSQDVGKAIDKMSGTAPATEAARQWDGFGSALKPAIENWYLLRKPLDGTIAGNVLKHETGALNIDGCRVGTDEALGRNNNARSIGTSYVVQRVAMRIDNSGGLGRFPANFIHDGSPEVVECFPVTGASKVVSGVIRNKRSASRFFQTCPDNDPEDFVARKLVYGAKANKRDRDEGFYPRVSPTMGNGIGGKEHDPETATPKRNHHPTVKPTSLMRYLCRLITPPNGLILDPFMGSGSTGKAAILEGFRFIGIEQDADYLAIAEARLRHAHEQPRQPRPVRRNGNG